MTAAMPLNLNVSNPPSKVSARTGEYDPLLPLAFVKTGHRCWGSGIANETRRNVSFAASRIARGQAQRVQHNTPTDDHVVASGQRTLTLTNEINADWMGSPLAPVVASLLQSPEMAGRERSMNAHRPEGICQPTRGRAAGGGV